MVANLKMKETVRCWKIEYGNHLLLARNCHRRRLEHAKKE